MRRTTKTSPETPRRTHARSRTPRPAKEPTVAIIGAGRLGTALGLALKSTGYRIEVVAAKRPASVRRAARAFGPKTLALSAHQLRSPNQSQIEILNRSFLVLIATPDDAIATLAEQLSEVFASDRTRPAKGKSTAAVRRVALHTSGALSSAVLEPMRSSGFAIGSLHPLVSISESRSGAELLTRGFFSIEGDSAAVRVGRSIVRSLHGESFTIEPSSKALYHAAALMASPNLTALFDIALEMLSVCGLSRKQAQRVLLPLLKSTVANLERQDPARALTGTFKRGDVSTVREHLAALKAANLPPALSAYLLLGQRSISMAKRLGQNSPGLDDIARILSVVTRNSSR